MVEKICWSDDFSCDAQLSSSRWHSIWNYFVDKPPHRDKVSSIKGDNFRNPCVRPKTHKPFLVTSAVIEKWLCQSILFRGLTCERSRLSLDPKIWYGSYFYLEILVCKFWQNWKMDHFPMLSGSWLTKKLHRGGSDAWRASKLYESGY